MADFRHLRQRFGREEIHRVNVEIAQMPRFEVFTHDAGRVHQNLAQHHLGFAHAADVPNGFTAILGLFVAKHLGREHLPRLTLFQHLIGGGTE